MKSKSKTYEYSGRVFDAFGNVLDYHWTGETYAPSLDKAMSNLKHQYREERDMAKHAKIILDGRVMSSDNERIGNVRK